VILGKKISLIYNDRQLWNEILPNILEDKDSEDDCKSDENYGK